MRFPIAENNGKIPWNFGISLDIFKKIMYNNAQFNGCDEEDTHWKCRDISRQRDGGWCEPCADLCDGLWLLSRCVETASANADGG